MVSKDKAKEILDEIFWNSLPVIRMEKQYDDESDSWLETDNMVIDYRTDVANLFQTTFYQLTGETSPNNVSLALYSHSKYSELSNGQIVSGVWGLKPSEYPVWCCRVLYNDLEMVVDAEYPFSVVLAHAGHEMGHARHRLKHENYHEVSWTLKEGIAEIFEAAMLRTIGDYAGVNSINLGFEYPATLNFNNVWDDIYQDLDDIEKPHNRGRALAWLALLNDSNLHMLKKEVEEAGFLSAQSLLFLADYFAAMSTSESDSYIDLHLTKSNMNDAKNFIRERVTRRNSTAPTQGFIKEKVKLWFLP